MNRQEVKHWFYKDGEWKLYTVKELSDITGLTVGTVNSCNWRKQWTRSQKGPEPTDIPEMTYGYRMPIKTSESPRYESPTKSISPRNTLDEDVKQLKQQISEMQQQIQQLMQLLSSK